MSRVVSIVIAALVWAANADVYQFSNVLHQGRTVSGLKIVYIKGPTIINVDELSWVTPGSSDVNGSAIVAISPAGVDSSRTMDCAPNLEPTVLADHHNIYVSGPSSAGSVQSFEISVKESGAYIVQFASCCDKPQVVTFTISGPGLGAHEQGWVFQYTALLLFYTGLSFVWWRNRKHLGETPAVSMIVSCTCLLFVGMACAGVALHILPQKAWLLKVIFTALTVGGTSLLMTTLLSATAIGFGGIGWFGDVACIIFMGCNTLALTNVEKAYETFCGGLTCTTRWRQWSVMLPLVTVFNVFCVSCFFCLMRSKRSYKQIGAGPDASFYQRLGVVVVIYTVLSMISAIARTRDLPFANGGAWTSHYVADVVGHLTQAFGLTAVVCVFRMDLPACALSYNTVRETCGESATAIAVDKLDQFALDNESDSETSPIKTLDTTPVVYGSPE